MKLQVIQDNKGKATGIFIPISDWNKLKRKYKELDELEDEESSKEILLKDLRQAIAELKLIEKGKLKARPVKELLDEL